MTEIREGLTPRRASDTNPPLQRLTRKSAMGVSPRCPTSLYLKKKAVAFHSISREELITLQQRYDTSLSHWNKLFNVLSIFTQWSLNAKDKLSEEFSRREDELISQLKSQSEECREFICTCFKLFTFISPICPLCSLFCSQEKF